MIVLKKQAANATREYEGQLTRLGVNKESRCFTGESNDQLERNKKKRERTCQGWKITNDNISIPLVISFLTSSSAVLLNYFIVPSISTFFLLIAHINKNELPIMVTK